MTTNDPSQPEYLGPEYPYVTGPVPGSGRRRRRTGLVAGVAVAVVGAVGVGAYGVTQLMAGGTSPATAVPADALGYVSLDLDPSAAQKIEAITILRKFPALRSELKIGSRDDLRKRLFTEIRKDGSCPDLSYAEDVEPWIGDRVALAAVPGKGDKVLPLVALQVTDQDKARTGMRALETCDKDDSTLGIAAVGDYLLISEHQSEPTRWPRRPSRRPWPTTRTSPPGWTGPGTPASSAMYASKDAADAVVAEQKGAPRAVPPARPRR